MTLMKELCTFTKLLPYYLVLLSVVFSSIIVGQEDKIIRLNGGNGWSGTPQIKWGGYWMSICADGDGNYLQLARLTCRDLGFLQGSMQVLGDILPETNTLTANCIHADSTKECTFVPFPKCVSHIHLSCQFPGFLGCFNHRNSSSGLNKVLSSFTEFTIQKCIEGCRGEGYDFAGVARGTNCLCGDTIATRQTDDYLCQAFPCPDDTYQSCGGGSHMSIYDASFGKCGGNADQYPSYRRNSYQYIVSPHYPQSSKEVDCRWAISFPEGTTEVQVIFADLLLRQDSFLKFSYPLSNGYLKEEYLTNTDDRPVEFVQNFEEVSIVSMVVQLASSSNESLARFAMYYKAKQSASNKRPSASSEGPNSLSYITSSTTSMKVSTTEMPPTKLNLNYVFGWALLGVFMITVFTCFNLNAPCKTHKRNHGEGSHSVQNHPRCSKQVSLSSTIDDDVNNVHLNRFVSDGISVSHNNIVELVLEQQKGCYFIENESGKKITCKSQEPTEVATDDDREYYCEIKISKSIDFPELESERSAESVKNQPMREWIKEYQELDTSKLTISYHCQGLKTHPQFGNDVFDDDGSINLKPHSKS